MITLAPAAPLVPPALLAAPGAFAWWYVDLLDDAGDGLVLIWSWGLPFLPGVTGAIRAGAAAPAAARPSINLAVYEGGKESFYLLQERDPARCSYTPAPAGPGGAGGCTWRFGETEITASWSADGAFHLRAAIDLPAPAGTGRVHGQVQVEGRVRGGRAAAVGAILPDHEWAPLCLAAQGEAALRCGAWSFARSGRAYHDRNAGVSPLHTLGIGRWWWGRLAFPDRELVFYRLVAEGAAPARDLVLEVRPDGAARVAAAAAIRVEAERRSLWGLRWPARLSFDDPDGRPVAVRLVHGVDDGPFYQRFLVEGRCDGASARGLAELVAPARFDPPYLRPLVRMRVHHPEGADSPWLPLFAGPAAGRWGRLLGRPPALTGGAA